MRTRTFVPGSYDPSNPFNAKLDPRTALPEYARGGAAHQMRLRTASKEYREAADLLESTLVEVEAEFASAFEADDKRRAVQERINAAGSGAIQAAHRNRMNRIG